MSIEDFGTLANGTLVQHATISSEGLQVSILTLGAIIQEVRLPSVPYSLTLGSNELAAYEGPMNYYGALVGPVANRIGGATATIDGRVCQFEINEGTDTTLHGGTTGTHSIVWTISEHGPDFVLLTTTLADGMGGFPADREISVRYAVSGTSLTMQVDANSSDDTILNLANHSYWNLDGTPTAANHTLRVAADQFTPVDEKKIPTGVAMVENTPFDYREPRSIGYSSNDRIDHNLCLTGGKAERRNVATLVGGSGISMELSTTEPGLQVYDAEHGNTGGFAGFQGATYGPLSGIALEAQGWPDAPNHPDFPSIALGKGQTYSQTTCWTFKH